MDQTVAGGISCVGPRKRGFPSDGLRNDACEYDADLAEGDGKERTARSRVLPDLGNRWRIGHPIPEKVCLFPVEVSLCAQEPVRCGDHRGQLGEMGRHQRGLEDREISFIP